MDWSVAEHWYDAMNPWSSSDEFYLSLVMQADDVVDVGCGTGTILKRARRDGHRGRLCGIDPDPAMLDQARSERSVDWRMVDAASMPFDAEFDLAIMTGHAFQLLITDDELRSSLAAIHRSLRLRGLFAFETRNPNARAWERWDGVSYEVANTRGAAALVSYEVLDVTGDVVHLTETLSGRWWDRPQTSEALLRFLDPAALRDALTDAGFIIDQQYGDWDGSPLGEASREIITLARA